MTICCVYHKKRGLWELQAQNSSYSDRNNEAISAGTNGEIREVVDGDEPSDFDFDAVANEVEMKVKFRTRCLGQKTILSGHVT